MLQGWWGPSTQTDRVQHRTDVADWIKRFRTLNADFPQVDKEGLSIIIQAGVNQYASAVQNHLVYALRDVYVCTLKKHFGLWCQDAQDVALRVLAASVRNRKQNFSFALSSDDDSSSKTVKRDPEREAAVVRAVEQEHEVMGTSMQTCNDAFGFLRRLQCRLAEDDARRHLVNAKARSARAFSLAPLTAMKPCFVRVDKTALTQLWMANFLGNKNVKAPHYIEDVLQRKARRTLTLGNSFQTDGTQVVVPYLCLSTRTQLLTVEQRDKRAANDAERAAKLEAYHAQRARFASGLQEPEEVRIHWSSVKPRHPVNKSTHRLLTGSFQGATHGIFARESA